VVILFGYALGVALMPRLPEEGRLLSAFLLPTAAALTCALLRSLLLRHPLDDAAVTVTLPTFAAMMLWFVAFLTALHATVLLALAGFLSGRVWAARIVPALLGLTLIGIGNLLPRTRPNLAIGIPAPGTLADRELWMRLHRTVGYLVVALGGVILVSSIALPTPLGPMMGRLIEPAVLFGIPALVLYSRRLVRVKAARQ
jgi:uncharacterized membrane protein